MLGTPVDPMLFLSGHTDDGSPGWGGFLNGMIPTSELCPLASSGQLLRCDAALAFDALASAYRDSFGTDLCITDSYRSFALQVTTFANKPGLAAVPGTSNHGWGLAVDLCGGIEGAGSPQHAWMQEHAPAFGWVHPDWAEPERWTAGAVALGVREHLLITPPLPSAPCSSASVVPSVLTLARPRVARRLQRRRHPRRGVRPWPGAPPLRRRRP